MDAGLSIANFDILELMRTPNVSLYGTLRLSKAIRKLAPEQATAPVQKAIGRLDEWIERADFALTARRREQGTGLARAEVDFDRAVDSTWVDLRDQLLRWTAYAHEGLEFLPEEVQDKAGLPAARKKHERAKKVYQRLFASGGLDFTRWRFFEQADAMAAVLRLIEEDELADDIDFVAGPEPLQALRTYQEFYEDMVDDRLSRKQGSAENLGELRVGLRRQLKRYGAALSTMLDEDEPESLEIVLAAIRPNIRLMEELSKVPSEEEVDYDLIDPPEPGEVEAQSEAEAPEPG